jgi:hypothetical protein
MLFFFENRRRIVFSQDVVKSGAVVLLQRMLILHSRWSVFIDIRVYHKPLNLRLLVVVAEGKRITKPGIVVVVYLINK